MGWSFGNVFRDAARVMPKYRALAADAPARELQQLQIQQILQDMKDQQEVGEVLKGLDATETEAAATTQVATDLASAAHMSPKDSKISTEAYLDRMEARYKVKVAPEVRSALLKGDPDTTRRFLKDSVYEISADPTMSREKFAQVLGDGESFLKSYQKTALQVQAERKQLEEQTGEAESKGGELPDGSVLSKKRDEAMRNKAQIASIDARIAQREKAVNALLSAGKKPELFQGLITQIKMLKEQRDELKKPGEELDKIAVDEEIKIGGERRAEQRTIDGEIRQDKMGDEDRWQQASVDLWKQKQQQDMSFSSPEGKIVEDIAKAEKLYGAGSQQVAALKDALGGGPPDLTAVGGMRKEFTQLSGDFITVRDSIARIEESAKMGEGPGDLALIFNYMKMLDPKSVVRESEFANAEMSSEKLAESGVPSFILKFRDQILKGSRLTDGQRKQYLSASRQLYETAKTTHKLLESQYTDLAERNKIDPKDVVIDFLGNGDQGKPDIDALLDKYK